MSAPFPNIYNHRRVAETAARACDICYRPSSSVLITPDSKDFFYICLIHLKDRNFCTPKIDEDAARAGRREKELAEEKEKVIKEYEDRKQKKKEKEEEKADDKDKEDKDKVSKKDQDKKNTDKAKVGSDGDSPPAEEEPRVFELKGAFYQGRLQKKRQSEAAKRDVQRISQPGFFPSVPTNKPGK